jgi:hypothetical protein
MRRRPARSVRAACFVLHLRDQRSPNPTTSEVIDAVRWPRQHGRRPNQSRSTEEMQMIEMNALVDDYLMAWNEVDSTARRALVNKVWASDGTYIDPLVSAAGTAAIDEVIAGAQEQFAGMRFVRGGVFESHHNIARFTWELVPAGGGESVVVGFDVAVLGADDKIAGVYGFIDKMPG